MKLIKLVILVFVMLAKSSDICDTHNFRLLFYLFLKIQSFGVLACHTVRAIIFWDQFITNNCILYITTNI